MRTPEELSSLWHRFKTTNDPASRNDLIEEYTYLVRITAGRATPGINQKFPVNRDDLFSAGAIGLIHAVDRFDPDRGFKFETLAISLIRGAILEFLRGEDPVSRTVRTRIKRVEAGELYFEQERGRTPTDLELADFLQMEEEEVCEARKDFRQSYVQSLDQEQWGHDGTGNLTRADLLSDDRSEHSPEQQFHQRTKKEQLTWAIDHLPERERTLISLYFYDGMSCPEIARIIGVSDNRAHQIYHQALKRLRTYLGHMADLFDAGV